MRDTPPPADLRQSKARLAAQGCVRRDTLPVVTERVEPYDLALGVPLRWEPNAPDVFLVSDDMGRGALAQRAHPDDPDQRCVVLRWDVVSYALMGPPNDEARNHIGSTRQG